MTGLDNRLEKRIRPGDAYRPWTGSRNPGREDEKGHCQWFAYSGLDTGIQARDGKPACPTWRRRFMTHKKCCYSWESC